MVAAALRCQVPVKGLRGEAVMSTVWEVPSQSGVVVPAPMRSYLGVVLVRGGRAATAARWVPLVQV